MIARRGTAEYSIASGTVFPTSKKYIERLIKRGMAQFGLERDVRDVEAVGSNPTLPILISWMIAFVEYCFQVPANRIGHSQFSAAQLKTIQEVITLIIFSIFSVVYLERRPEVELPRRISDDYYGGALYL